MSANDVEARLSSRLLDVFWVPFDAEFDSGPHGFSFSGRPHSERGDQIRIVAELPNTVRLDVRAVPEAFCTALVETMAGATPSKRRGCQERLRELEPKVEGLLFRANGADLVHLDCDSWPSEWTSFEYGFTVRPLPRCDTQTELFQVAEEWVVDAFRPIFDLLDVSFEGGTEGDVQRVLSNDYERDAGNRRLCIQHHGCACAVCGFDFGRVYGTLGEGFIHVHHIVPVSELGPGYVVDPINDLIPVCPNCHAMLHRTDPPLTPDQLKMVLARNVGASG